MRRRNNKKRKLRKILILAVMAVLCIAVISAIGAGIYFILNKEKPPVAEDYMEQYAAYVKSGEYSSIYELLSETAKTQITLEDFCLQYENFYNGLEASNIQVQFSTTQEAREERLDAEEISYTVAMNSIGGDMTFNNNILFTRTPEKTYTLDWVPKDIYPGFQIGDKISVKSTACARGNIFDRNNQPLAHEGVASSVGVVPGKLTNPREEQITKLAELLDVSAESIQKKLNAGWVKDDLFVPIRTVSKSAEELKASLLDISGVKITDTKLRFYPLGSAASHLVGYVQNITAEELEEKKGQHYNSNSIIGKAGLEKLFEDRLRGSDGYSVVLLNSEGQPKESFFETYPENGEDIYLTIDSNVQLSIYNQLANDKGTGAATNPITGEILALVSTPAFDSNDFVMGYTSNGWSLVNDNPNQPLFNRFRSTWCPGSAIKPIVAALGITQGTLDPNSTINNYEGLKWQLDSSWKDYYVTTLSSYDNKNLQNALIYSDNIYFAQAALGMGIDGFSKGLDSLGFKEPLSASIEMTSSSYGKDGIPDTLKLANSGYGQANMLVNPLHMAAMYSALVNDGSIPAPSLIKDTAPAVWKANVFTSEASDTVMQNLVQIVNNPKGTAHGAKLESIVIGGKTGTAEIKDSQDDTEGTELGWFVGLTPKDYSKPFLAVLMIEDVKDKRGSHYVVPKAKEIFDNYLSNTIQ